MCIDFGRSCYSQPMSFVSNDPTIQATATWYFCAPTALPFPYPCAFGSPTWDTVHPTITNLGFDATKPRKYYNGRRLNASDGRTFAGPAEYFLNGAPAPAILPRGVNDTPIVCLQPPHGAAKGGLCVPVVSALGGVGFSGRCVSGITPGIPCAYCSGTTPGLPVITIAGAAGNYTVLNGVQQLAQIASCNWQKIVAPPALVALSRIPPGQWQCVLFSSIGTTATYLLATADCTTPVTLPVSIPDVGAPPSVALSFN
jgi:hypothetical protein